MPTYAHIDEDVTVSRMQVFATEPEIPQHKRRADGGLYLRPVDDPGAPDYFAPFQILRQSAVVDLDRVRIVYEVSDKEIGEQISAIKLEAQRRIYSRFPQWKQANMTARAVGLLRAGEQNWTDEEKAEAGALDGAWVWIKTVRIASGEVEAMNPLPHDYDDNKWWPA